MKKLIVLILFVLISVGSFAQSWNYRVYKTIEDVNGKIIFKLEYGTKEQYDGRAKWRFTNMSSETLTHVSINDKVYDFNNGKIARSGESFSNSTVLPNQSITTLSDAINPSENYGNWSDKNDNPIVDVSVKKPEISFMGNGGIIVSWSGTLTKSKKTDSKVSTSKTTNTNNLGSTISEKLAIAKQLIKQGDYQTAERRLKEVEYNDPYNKEAKTLRAEIKRKKNTNNNSSYQNSSSGNINSTNYTQTPNYSGSISVDQQNRSMQYSNKAVALYNEGSYEEAEMYAKKAMEINPNNEKADLLKYRSLKAISNTKLDRKYGIQMQEIAANDARIEATTDAMAQQSVNIINGKTGGEKVAGVFGVVGAAQAGGLINSTGDLLGVGGAAAGLAIISGMLNKEKELGLTGDNLTKQYKNAVYKGSLNDGKHNGNGIITYIDGSYAEGIFDDEIFHGEYIRPGLFVCKFPKRVTATKDILPCVMGFSKELTFNVLFNEGEFMRGSNLVFSLGIDFADIFKTKYNGTMYRNNLAVNLDYSGEFIRKGVMLSSYKIDSGLDISDLGYEFSGSITNNSFTVIISGEFNRLNERKGKCKVSWTGNKEDSFTCKYINGKREGKVKFLFSDGTKLKTKYKRGYMKNTELASGIELNLNNLQFELYNSLSEKERIKISRILIVHYEDLLNHSEFNKAEDLLENIVCLVSNTEVFNDYNKQSLHFFTYERAPAYILSQYSISSLSKFILNMESFIKEMENDNYEIAYRKLFSASKHYPLIPDKSKQKLKSIGAITSVSKLVTFNDYINNSLSLRGKVTNNSLYDEMKYYKVEYEKIIKANM